MVIHLMISSMSFTTIRIELDTREKLRDLGRKGETYNEIIKRLIEIASSEKRSADTQSFNRPTRPSDFG
jgi:predicted CopG family antitoxin